MIDITTDYHISDDEIEGENKVAGRKKETMKRAVMAAWEAWEQSTKNENSQIYADLLDVCQKFILRKVKKAWDQLDKAGTAQTPKDFAQDVILKFLKGKHFYKSFNTHAKFYSYLNTTAFNATQDAYNAVNKHKSRFVKDRNTVENDSGETEEIDNILLHPEPRGFHGRMIRPPIPFGEMTEDEKLVCAIRADNQQERILDGLVDRIIAHDGREYYDIIPVRTYKDIAEQLTKWKGTTSKGNPWKERTVRNIIHRLNKKGEKRDAEQQTKDLAHRAAWQAWEQRKRDRLAAILKARKAPAQHISRAQCAEMYHIEDACLLGRQSVTEHREEAA